MRSISPGLASLPICCLIQARFPDIFADCVAAPFAGHVLADLGRSCPREHVLGIDPADVARKLTPRTRAIMPVHLYGHPCDMEALTGLAERHGTPCFVYRPRVVDAAWRGRGIGELMLLAMLDRSIELGAHEVTLEVRVSNTVAQNLYCKYGFEVVGRRSSYYRDNDEDAVVMRLDLSDRPAAAR